MSHGTIRPGGQRGGGQRLAPTGDLVSVAASSPATARVVDLQFTLGEGPCLAAVASRSPVLVPDLDKVAATTWPGYGPAAHDHGVRAVFAFPLQVGTARLGALDVYRDEPGAMTAHARARAPAYAHVAIQMLLDAHDEPDQIAALMVDERTRAHVYQAQGIAMTLALDAAEALARMRAYAFAQDRRLTDVAEDIIGRKSPSSRMNRTATEAHPGGSRVLPNNFREGRTRHGDDMAMISAVRLRAAQRGSAWCGRGDLDVTEFLQWSPPHAVDLVEARGAGLLLVDDPGRWAAPSPGTLRALGPQRRPHRSKSVRRLRLGCTGGGTVGVVGAGVVDPKLHGAPTGPRSRWRRRAHRVRRGARCRRPLRQDQERRMTGPPSSAQSEPPA